MKRLFDENERYTDEALKICRELELAVGKIFKKYGDQGYSLRELGYLGITAVNIMEAELILFKGLNFKRFGEAIGKAKEVSQ